MQASWTKLTVCIVSAASTKLADIPKAEEEEYTLSNVVGKVWFSSTQCHSERKAAFKVEGPESSFEPPLLFLELTRYLA